MNRVELIGRLTADPNEFVNGDSIISKYNLAVDGRGKDAQTDFINIVSFGKAAEFSNKYFKKGMKVAISGRIKTGSYLNKEGKKVYTTDVIAEEQEFCEKKGTFEEVSESKAVTDSNGFMDIPDGIDETLPFM